MSQRAGADTAGPPPPTCPPARVSVAAAPVVAGDGRELRLAFRVVDGDQGLATEEVMSVFHAPWLWANDPAHLHPSSGQRTRVVGSFYSGGGWRIAEDGTAVVAESPLPKPPLGSLHGTGSVFSVPATTAPPATEFLRLTWHRRTRHDESGDDRRVSYYPLHWLWERRYDDAAQRERAAATVVGPAVALSRTRGPQVFQLADLVPDGGDRDDGDEIDPCREALFRLLRSIVQDGAALLRGAPASAEEEAAAGSAPTVARLAQWLAGGTSHGRLYGDTFHVVNTANANNIAYTTEALAPHQDLAYYESQPGLQLLHCLANDAATVTGGESTLIDALAAATELRRLAPELFDVLAAAEGTFVKQRGDADLVYRGRYISVDCAGVVIGVRWSPPFEGPESPDPARAADLFLAKAAFECMLDLTLPEEGTIEPLEPILQAALRDYAQLYTWEYRLRPGDVLIFNNQRMLHGRRGFQLHEQAQDGDRHLVGCYTNMEETLNTYRLLCRQRLGEDSSLAYHRLCGNNSSGV